MIRLLVFLETSYLGFLISEWAAFIAFVYFHALAHVQSSCMSGVWTTINGYAGKRQWIFFCKKDIKRRTFIVCTFYLLFPILYPFLRLSSSPSSSLASILPTFTVTFFFSGLTCGLRLCGTLFATKQDNPRWMPSLNPFFVGQVPTVWNSDSLLENVTYFYHARSNTNPSPFPSQHVSQKPW